MADVAADDIRRGLTEAASRRVEADRARASAMVDIATWVHAGHEAGIPIAEMARLVGMTRPTIYAILDDET